MADTDPDRRATSACRDGRDADAGRFTRSEGHGREKGRERKGRREERGKGEERREGERKRDKRGNRNGKTEEREKNKSLKCLEHVQAMWCSCM